MTLSPTFAILQIDKFNQALDIILNDDEELGRFGYIYICTHLSLINIYVPFRTEDLPEEQQQELEDAAAVAYGMIHARYITTAAGLHRMVSEHARLQFSCRLNIHQIMSICINTA